MKNMEPIKSKIKEIVKKIKRSWFFRISILDEIKNFGNFIKNIWLFRKELWNFRWWDYSYTLEMMKRSLEIMSHKIETRGYEVESSRMKKVRKMKRAIQIIENFYGTKHVEMAEEELGPLILRSWEFEEIENQPQYKRLVDNLSPEERDYNRKIFARSREIEEAEWKELWKIFEGQEIEEYRKMADAEWDEWFDGSGMRGWWD